MSSRSIIAIQKGRTTTTIYCHFDGYPTSVGKILYDNYTDEKKINELMELGNLSSLGETIKDCVFYIRDRHEPADENKAVIIPAIYGKQPKQILELLDSGQNYLYLFKDGIWFYIDMFEKKKFMPLETAINESKNKRSMGNMNKIVKSYEEFVNESKLNEGMSDYYAVEYYEFVGQHGELDSYNSLAKAIKNAEKFKKEQDAEGYLGEEIMYIGVSGDTDEFAIIYMTDYYLNQVISPDMFSSPTGFKKFRDAGLTYLKTKKTQVDTF
jgi:hypothetical protein